MELTSYKDLNKLANPYVIKCILLGDSGVGKSTLLKVLKAKDFTNTYEATIGIDFDTMNITLPDYNDHKIKLQIWDTAGQERFKAINYSFYRNAFAVLLVYDITNRKSFQNIEKWRK